MVAVRALRHERRKRRVENEPLGRSLCDPVCTHMVPHAAFPSFLVFTNQPSPELQQYALSLGARFFFDKADFFEIGDAVAQLKTEKETSRIAAAAQ